MKRSVSWLNILAAAAVLHLALSGAMSLTKRPWADEAWFANISWSMLHHGNTGISVLDPRGNANMLGREFPEIDKHYYIWLPVQQAAYAAWYAVFGLHVFSMRAFSMLWGLLALLAWFQILRRLTDNPLTAALAAVFIATDFAFVDASSDGRMDIMTAALSASAMAAYLTLRERRLNAAILVSQALAVTAGLTHPMGAIGFICLFFLTILLDWRSLGLRQVLLAAAVYAAGAAAAAAYLWPGLDLFQAQFSTALTGRLGVANSVADTLLREITVKYRSFYLPAYASGAAIVRALIPFLYVASFIALLCSKNARSRPGYSRFLALAAVALGSIAALDSGKLYYYLVHSTPLWAAAVALWLMDCRERGAAWRAVSRSAAISLLLLNFGWAAREIRRNPYHQSFLPMARFVRQKIDSSKKRPYIVTGSAELGFAVGFDPPLVDDALLGFASGKHPDLFVWEPRTYASHWEGFQKYRPEVANYITRLRETEFRKVYTDGYYSVYERLPSVSSSP